LSLGRIGPVAGEAVGRQDRANLAIEIDRRDWRFGK
jgi:hypothetical protein